MNPMMFRAMALRGGMPGGGNGMSGQPPAPPPSTPGGMIPSPMQPQMGGVPNQPMPMQRKPMPGVLQNVWGGGQGGY